MQKNLALTRPRQQNLAFAANDEWEKLPNEVRAQFQQRLGQLLETIIRAERKERSAENERQDSE